MNESTRADLPASQQTIREHFAAMAMQGFIASNHPITHRANCEELISEVSVAMADALIAELAKPVQS